jgi:hypothetical protein
MKNIYSYDIFDFLYEGYLIMLERLSERRNKLIAVISTFKVKLVTGKHGKPDPLKDIE